MSSTVCGDASYTVGDLGLALPFFLWADGSSPRLPFVRRFMLAVRALERLGKPAVAQR